MDNREIGRDTPYTRPAKFNMKAFMALVRQTKPAYWQLALGWGFGCGCNRNSIGRTAFSG